MRTITAALGLILVAGNALPALATSRGYVLVETTANAGTIEQTLGHGLANCLALHDIIFGGEIVAHLECNDLASLNTAVADIAKKDGVKRATLWMVVNGE
jgi:hypothetical protein